MVLILRTMKRGEVMRIEWEDSDFQPIDARDLWSARSG